jgi:hypothetical protein
MIFKELNLFIRLSEHGEIITTVLEPESGEQTTLYSEFSPDEHPEFNEQLGNEIYSWLSLWTDEVNDANKTEI